MRTLDRFSALLSVRGDMLLESIDTGAQCDVLDDVEGSGGQALQVQRSVKSAEARVQGQETRVMRCESVCASSESWEV